MLGKVQRRSHPFDAVSHAYSLGCADNGHAYTFAHGVSFDGSVSEADLETFSISNDEAYVCPYSKANDEALGDALSIANQTAHAVADTSTNTTPLQQPNA